MKQVAIRNCQIRNQENKIITVETGQVITYSEEHPHLRPIEGENIDGVDFMTASEDELMEANYKLENLKMFIVDVYKVPVRVRSKKKLVEKLMDCRFREVGAADLNRLG